MRALVVRRPSHTALTEGEVISRAREHLAGYKCPTAVDFAAELPRNASGKVFNTHSRVPWNVAVMEVKAYGHRFSADRADH
ncbi:hypothetical protein ACFWDX_53225 [Streptomyces mirabilis]|uniref:AMP-binding enzyme n=1 Tax=Streptomyces mirabilis TaxID=68239 RepID=UPI003669E383